MGGAVGESITRGGRAGARGADPAARDLRLRRRAHAGGLRLADADGQDEPGDRAAERGGHPLHLAAHRPHLRRRERLVRDARRRADRGARRAHRVRRPVGDRADDPPEAARRLPDGRLPDGARDARPGRDAREPRAARCATWSHLHAPIEEARQADGGALAAAPAGDRRRGAGRGCRRARAARPVGRRPARAQARAAAHARLRRLRVRRLRRAARRPRSSGRTRRSSAGSPGSATSW